MRRLLFVISLLSLCYSCSTHENYEKKLSIQNYSDSAIYVYIDSVDYLQVNRRIHLFDTNIKEKKDEYDAPLPKISSPDYRVNAYNISSMNSPIIGGSESYPLINSKDSTLHVFFISESTMKNYSWKEICEKQMYLKKESYTLRLLNIKEWWITYFKD